MLFIAWAHNKLEDINCFIGVYSEEDKRREAIEKFLVKDKSFDKGDIVTAEGSLDDNE